MNLGPFIRYLYKFTSNFRCFEVLLSVFRLESDFTDELVDLDDIWKKRKKDSVETKWKMKKMRYGACHTRFCAYTRFMDKLVLVWNWPFEDETGVKTL